MSFCVNIHLSNYRKIYILDSLPSGHPQAVFKLVESALVEEAKNKLGIQLDVERILHIKVPVGDTPLARSYEFYHAPPGSYADECPRLWVLPLALRAQVYGSTKPISQYYLCKIKSSPTFARYMML